jgi:hypothetical protein
MWVKGEASGAVLNVQLRRPRPDGGGINDHIVKLDFSGWRYITFALTREADSDKTCDYDWPYLAAGPAYAIFERGLANPNRIGSLALWLNGVPVGGRSRVEISEVRALPTKKLKFEKAAVVLNGVKHELPFALTGGEYAELTDGFWTRFSMNSERLERRPAPALMPKILAGTNEVCFEGLAEDGSLPRAEVTLMAIGDPFPAINEKLLPQQERVLSYEAQLPEKWAPAAGFATLSPIKVRPGKKARIELEIVGPIARPVLTIGEEEYAFEVDVGENEKLVVKDGQNWIVRGPCSKVIKQGKCQKAFALLSGVNKLSLSSAAAGQASAQVRIIKRMDDIQ